MSRSKEYTASLEATATIYRENNALIRAPRSTAFPYILSATRTPMPARVATTLATAPKSPLARVTGGLVVKRRCLLTRYAKHFRITRVNTGLINSRQTAKFTA